MSFETCPLDFFASHSSEEILSEMKSSKDGLSDSEAASRLAEFGPNEVEEKKEIGVVLEFLSHFRNPLVLILLAAASVSAYLGEMKNSVVIGAMVFASVILDFFEEHRANDAAKKLKEKVSVTATVIRNGAQAVVRASDVCVGDILVLSSGDLVSADARIIQADDFFINQSALTGESYPREKHAEWHGTDGADAGNTDTVVFLGSSVVSGMARAVVFQTGQATTFGHIAKDILGREQKSEFEIGISRFGFFIMKAILAMTLFILFANALMQRDLLESFIFAVAIAVGVTPELLPVIMSITMANGSQRMAKKGVIVKKLSAIPNLGSMDILCTDKTGTLTEDKIRLVTYTDIHGTEDENVFLYTYLNSSYQTGVRNPLDKAVLEYRKTDIGAYAKTEEIPFDFDRKMMSVAVSGPDGLTLITKGAPEEVLCRCSSYRAGGKDTTLSSVESAQAMDRYRKLSADGFRVLALAVRRNVDAKENYTKDDERGMTFAGFVSFLDPAKQDVGDVLTKLGGFGVEVKIVTGDNELVTEKICRDVGLSVRGVLVGSEIEALDDEALAIRAESITVFARFSPDQKNRVITVLRARGHVVGYLGDGINDAPSLKTADVGISVENAVDIAKETADIILTDKHLRSVVDGIVEGRRTFGNTMKYVMMVLSSNFGNMFSVLGAIFYLPFLPMLPIQILLNNFIYDFSQITIPSDNVDADWVSRPHKWNLLIVKKFMFVFGPISSVFDFLTFFVLFSVFHLGAGAFQTGWFLESLATQTLVIHVIRTRQIPFFQSRASKLLTISTLGAVGVGWLIPLTPLGNVFSFSPVPVPALFAIVGLVVLYLALVEVVKRIFYRKYQF